MNVERDWLARYHAGRRAEVWHELRQLGSLVREPDVVEQAQLVCDEMARRARHNIEVIIERLTSQGFRFHSNDDEQEPATPFFPTTSSSDQLADWLVAHFGQVPLTMLSWLRLVGDVWLVGTHPDWPESAAADPLVIELEGSKYPNDPMWKYYESEVEAWQDWSATDPTAGLFPLPIASDRLHKNNISGGPPYGVIVPDACADGLFVGETTTPFVDYLNWVFRNGGFPWPTAGAGQWRVKSALAADLLPL